MDGDIAGEWQGWRESGQPLQSGCFKKGARIGLLRRYNGDGQLWMEGNYKGGKIVCEWEIYEQSGDLMQQITYKDVIERSAWNNSDYVS